MGIPFCPTRCAYCSFVSNSVEKSFHLVEPYLEALDREIDSAAGMVKELGLRVKSFYMGGGTPTTLTAEQMDRLLCTLEENFDLNVAREFTIEAGRPDSINESKLKVMKAHGIQRISINPQTLNQKTLDVIGRRHTVEDVERAFQMARKAGFSNINMDLILGLPGENSGDVEKTLEGIRRMAPDSLTVHSLAVKRASRLNQNLDCLLYTSPSPRD